MDKEFQYVSDPVHGFIAIPRDVLLPLVSDPWVQRMRYIRQIGVGYLVFPTAEHSRFTHALGAMALMGDALNTLESKGTPISEDERLASMAAALLHDLGHGPFSHSLEHMLLYQVPHEAMTKAMLRTMAARYGPPLDLAVQMFEGTYERPFFHELIASQLDMDRLDYLRRDSQMTGVVEGRIGVERILQTMQVHPTEGRSDACVAIEAKGLYAVENVLIARRLMYWQVYLHKAVIAGDYTLRAAIDRARHLIRHGRVDATVGGSPALLTFLKQVITKDKLDDLAIQERFANLDDADIVHSLKQWCTSPDKILADLSRRFIQRDLLRCVFLSERPDAATVDEWRECVATHLRTRQIGTPGAWKYYLEVDDTYHAAYKRTDPPVNILRPDGSVCPLTDIVDSHAIQALTWFESKPYVCLPKEVVLPHTHSK